jgi:RNA polymerase sigma-B factor
MVSSHAATMHRREERRLLLLYHGAGDASAREELVHRFLPLARQLARRYQCRGDPIDDLVQVASLGLLKAIDRFDPARQTALSSFGRPPTPAEVAERTQNTVEQVLEARQAAGARWAISLNSSGDEEDADAPADRLAIDEPGFLLAEDAATTERLMRVLTDRERETLRLRFSEDLYQSEVAERVGLSPTHVGRVLRRSVEALHETTTRDPSAGSWPQRTASDT